MIKYALTAGGLVASNFLALSSTLLLTSMHLGLTLLTHF